MRRVIRAYHLVAGLSVAAFTVGMLIGITGTVLINPPEHTHVMLNGSTIHGQMSK